MVFAFSNALDRVELIQVKWGTTSISCIYLIILDVSEVSSDDLLLVPWVMEINSGERFDNALTDSQSLNEPFKEFGGKISKETRGQVINNPFEVEPFIALV